jgi:hypothetical protein
MIPRLLFIALALTFGSLLARGDAPAPTPPTQSLELFRDCAALFERRIDTYLELLETQEKNETRDHEIEKGITSDLDQLTAWLQVDFHVGDGSEPDRARSLGATEDGQKIELMITDMRATMFGFGGALPGKSTLQQRLKVLRGEVNALHDFVHILAVTLRSNQSGHGPSFFTLKKQIQSGESPTPPIDLFLQNEDLTAEDIQTIGKLPSLQFLTLGFAPEGVVFKTTDLSPLGNLSQLTHLSISAPTLDQIDPAFLKRLEKLEHLSLRSNMDGTIKITSAWAQSLAALPNLKSIEIDGDLDDSVFAQLLAGSKLEELRIFTKNLTDADLAPLSGHPQLRVLELRSPALTDEAATTIGKLTSLEGLSINTKSLTGKFLEGIKGLTKLRDLTLSEIDGQDPGLALLGEMKSLTTLSVVCKRGTRFNFTSVAQHPKLQRFSTNGKTTEEDLKLVEAMPALEWSQLGSQVVYGPNSQPAPAIREFACMEMARVIKQGHTLDSPLIQQLQSIQTERSPYRARRAMMEYLRDQTYEGPLYFAKLESPDSNKQAEAQKETTDLLDALKTAGSVIGIQPSPKSTSFRVHPDRLDHTIKTLRSAHHPIRLTLTNPLNGDAKTYENGEP